MALPEKKRWTLEEVHALPDDGKKYELIHGELFVSPAPAPSHEYVVSRLISILAPYVVSQGLGGIFPTPSVFRVGRDPEVQPDLAVRSEGDPQLDWEFLPVPLLVVEVSSPSTRRYDRTTKRAVYMENGVPEYWIVDRQSRSVIIIRHGEDDVTVTDGETLIWSPVGATTPLTFEMSRLFA